MIIELICKKTTLRYTFQTEKLGTKVLTILYSAFA